MKRRTFGIAAHIAAVAGIIVLVHLCARLAYALFLPSVTYRLAEYDFWTSFLTYTSDPATTIPTHCIGLMLLCIALAIVLITLFAVTSWREVNK